MIIYAYRSGEIGFALRKAPAGAIALRKAPHSVAEKAVHGCARLAYDNQTWLVPGIPESRSDDEAYQALCDFGQRLNDRIHALRSAAA